MHDLKSFQLFGLVKTSETPAGKATAEDPTRSGFASEEAEALPAASEFAEGS